MLARHGAGNAPGAVQFAVILNRPADDFRGCDQTAFQVVDHISNLLRCGCPHQNIQAKGWWSSALGGSCAHLIEKFDGEFAAATHALNREIGIF
jgi:hypothetical protein